MEITILPKGINKIIEEYCYYPKKYLKELEYHTIQLRNDVEVLGYDPFLHGYSLNSRPRILYTKLCEIRISLMQRQGNRDLECGIKPYQNYTNKTHDPY